MDIDCPDCGRRVTLEANNIVPYHDNAPPLRSVCRASKEDATPVVEIIKRANAEEREACAAEVEALADQLQKEIDTTYPTGEALRELVAARTVLAKAVAAIRARSNGGAK